MSAGPLVRAAVDSLPAAALMRGLERLDSGRANTLRVLTYHRVDDGAVFADHVAHLASRYEVIGVDQLLAALRRDAPLPPRAVLITFDDGYRDFGERAWPVLRARGLPAVLFVVTAHAADPRRVFWWDRLRHAFQTGVAEYLDSAAGCWVLTTPRQRQRAFTAVRGYVKTRPHEEALACVDAVCNALDAPRLDDGEALDWSALRTLAAEGVALAPHTRTHPLLDRVTAARAADEILGSIDDLRLHTGAEWPLFAYPDGHFTPDVVGLLADSGVRAAFTTVRGTNDLRAADPLRLRRIDIGPRASRGALRARLLQSARCLNSWHRMPAGVDGEGSEADLVPHDAG